VTAEGVEVTGVEVTVIAVDVVPVPEATVIAVDVVPVPAVSETAVDAVPAASGTEAPCSAVTLTTATVAVGGHPEAVRRRVTAAAATHQTVDSWAAVDPAANVRQGERAVRRTALSNLSSRPCFNSGDLRNCPPGTLCYHRN
jgi:hypothetical protein